MILETKIKQGLTHRIIMAIIMKIKTLKKSIFAIVYKNKHELLLLNTVREIKTIKLISLKSSSNQYKYRINVLSYSINHILCYSIVLFIDT